MELQIVNPELGFSKAPLVEPTEYGYLYMAARVRSVIPWVLPSAKRARLLRVLKPLVRDLETLDGVLRAKVFRAIVRPPTARFSSYLNARRSLHVADFDVFVLVEARSRELAERMRESTAYLAVRSVLEREAEGLFVMSRWEPVRRRSAHRPKK